MNKIKEKFSSCPELLSLLAFIFGGVAVVYLTNNLFAAFAPFIIAYVVTRVLRPLMVKIRSKIKIPNILNTILCMAIFILCAGFVIWLFGHYLVEGIAYLIELFSSKETLDTIIAFAQQIWTRIDALTKVVHIDISINDIAGVVGNFATNLITLLSDISIGIATRIPNVLMSLIIGCVAAFYMLYDYDRLAAAINYQLSPKIKKFTSVINYQVLSSFIKMILSYALISTICFLELLLGFFILGVEDSVFIALIIAILDVLPILGSGAVLVPWGLISLLIGNAFVGVGLIVLWVIIETVRQIVEPKIVGSQIGLHPLLTLTSLYVGLKLMGGLGLIVGPLYILACKKLNDEGVVVLYKKPEMQQHNAKDQNDK